jgi:protocadherin-16/23
LGTVVAEVTANDVDSNPALTYSFAEGGNPDSAFSIDRFSGAVTLARRLDYESRRSYTLRVRALDAAHAALTTLTIHVTDENDNSPIFEQQAYEVALLGKTTFYNTIKLNYIQLFIVMKEIMLFKKKKKKIQKN